MRGGPFGPPLLIYWITKVNHPDLAQTFAALHAVTRQ